MAACRREEGCLPANFARLRESHRAKLPVAVPGDEGSVQSRTAEQKDQQFKKRHHDYGWLWSPLQDEIKNFAVSVSSIK